MVCHESRDPQRRYAGVARCEKVKAVKCLECLYRQKLDLVDDLSVAESEAVPIGVYKKVTHLIDRKASFSMMSMRNKCFTPI